MPNKNAARGYRLERLIQQTAEKYGLPARRAWGSDGRALGHKETVDLLIAGWRVQAKMRKRLATYLKPPEGTDVTIVKTDREEPLVIMTLTKFLETIQ